MIFKTIRITVFGLLFSVCNTLESQELLPVFHDTTFAGHELNIVGNVFEHSTSMYSDFSKKIIFGGEIDDDLKQKAFERQKDYNRLGGGFRLGIEYRGIKSIFKSKPELSWMLQISNEAHFSAEYSDDLFGLAFLGNEIYLGKEVSLANTSARFERFLNIGGGVHDRKTKSFITVNAVLPQDFFQMELYKSKMSFSEFGDRVDLSLNGEATLADSYAYFKGIGAMVNFDYNIPFGKPDNYNGIIRISGRNIGAYQIFDATLIDLDVEQSYAGFSMDEIGSDELLSSVLDTIGITNTANSKLKLLPGFLQIGKVVSSTAQTKFQSFYGLRMYINRVYRPLIYGGVNYRPTAQFSVGTQIAFGGYGAFRLGLYMNYNTDKIVLGFGTEDLLGAIFKNQFGHSGLIHLAWKF